MLNDNNKTELHNSLAGISSPGHICTSVVHEHSKLVERDNSRLYIKRDGGHIDVGQLNFERTPDLANGGWAHAIAYHPHVKGRGILPPLLASEIATEIQKYFHTTPVVYIPRPDFCIVVPPPTTIGYDVERLAYIDQEIRAGHAPVYDVIDHDSPDGEEFRIMRERKNKADRLENIVNGLHAGRVSEKYFDLRPDAQSGKGWFSPRFYYSRNESETVTLSERYPEPLRPAKTKCEERAPLLLAAE